MRIVLYLTVLLFSASASAKCMSQYMAYWPPPKATVGTLPVILINGMGGHQQSVKGLKGVELKASGHHVKLNKIATNVGAFRVTQTAWVPTEPLKPGKTYTLVVQGKSKTWRPSAYVGDADKKQRHTYTVAQTPRPALAWTGAPTVGEGSLRRMGCGPSINQIVELPTSRADGLVEVALKRGDQTRNYVLPVPKNGELRLGHGMCSGPFQVGGAGMFTATFSLVNDGTTNPGTTKTVTFPAVTGR